MKRTLGYYIFLLLSVVASFASIIVFANHFTPYLNEQGKIGILFLGILSVSFLLHNFYLIFKHSKYREKAKYTEIFGDINIGFSQLHAIGRNEEPSAEIIIQKLTLLCDNVSKAFERVYETNIGVCIKFLIYKDGKPLVQTLVRDSTSTANGRKTGISDDTEHWLEKNTDFQFISDNLKSSSVKGFFLNRNLPVLKDYKNTNLSDDWFHTSLQKLVLFENFLRRRCWPLKYCSTLIVPIVPLIADEQTQDTLRGFLCLDSPNEGVFNDKVDVDILKGVSDGFYNQIDRLKTIV